MSPDTKANIFIDRYKMIDFLIVYKHCDHQLVPKLSHSYQLSCYFWLVVLLYHHHHNASHAHPRNWLKGRDEVLYIIIRNWMCLNEQHRVFKSLQNVTQMGKAKFFSGMSEWLSLMIFFRHQGPCKPCNHNLYIGIIMFLHTYSTESTGQNYF